MNIMLQLVALFNITNLGGGGVTDCLKESFPWRDAQTICVSPFSATKLQEEDTICCLIRSMPPHCLACIHACWYHTNYKSGAEGSTMLFLIGKSKAN